MKSIIFVANTSWSLYNFRLGIVKALLLKGFKVVVIAPFDDYSLKLEEVGCDYFDIKLDNYGTNPFKDIRTIISLVILYRKIRPCIIFHYTIKPNIYGTLAAYINDIPSIAVTTGLGHLFYRNFFTKKITKQLYCLAGKLCKEMWFLNEQDVKDFLKEKIITEDKVVLLNSEGINTKHFTPQKSFKKDSKINFLFAGRLIKDKGLEILIDTAEKIKDESIIFSILGFIDSKNPNSITLQEIQEKHERGIINYLGDTADIRPFIAESDCIIFPSFYREGVSRILLEAASMGKPIITTDNVGCREVVQDGINGFLCEPKSIQSLEETIEKFISLSKEKRIEMGRAGRRIVKEQFSEKRIIDFYLDKITSITQN
ncbi:MAG: glycosyltransferase family 4 protein [Saprospiraceae bacterium]